MSIWGMLMSRRAAGGGELSDVKHGRDGSWAWVRWASGGRGRTHPAGLAFPAPGGDARRNRPQGRRRRRPQIDLGLDEPPADRVANQLDAVTHPQLAQHVGAV